MQLQQIANFNGLANGSRATAEIPNYANSLGKVQLQLSGSLTKATVTEIVMRIGSRAFFGPISAVDFDKIMAYRGHPANANFLSLDLCERDMFVQWQRELGAVDLPLLGRQSVFVEVLNNAASGNPGLVGLSGLLPRQFVDSDKDGKATRHEQLMHKLLRYSLPNTGTRYVWQPVFGGAQIKRVHFFYTGADWTATANGNLVSVDVKRNGTSVFDRIQCLPNRFHQTECQKVPQSRVFTVDFIADNDTGKALNTAGLRSLEFELQFTASDNVVAYVECLDIPGNL